MIHAYRFTFFCVRILGNSPSQGIEISADGFEGEQDSNCQEVEHIMNSGASEGAFELVSVAHLSYGNNCIGDRSTNIGSHDHVDTLLNRYGTSN